jgi:aryl-alcohol dehydrogenase-like predicted oxidoreductase
LIEGADQSLERAGLKAWDVIMAHRFDVSVPMIEIVKGFNHLITTGRCHYWGTSEWSVQQIQEAIGIAERLGLDPPLADQAQYNAFKRDRVEAEYAPLYKNHQFGLTIWSPLASGLLTGKYNDGIPKGSRFDLKKDMFNDTLKSLTETDEGKGKVTAVRELTKIAKSLDCSTSQLALAWAASNQNVSTVILGITKPEQLRENLGALDVIDKLTPEIHDQIEGILKNKPAEAPTYGRL